MSGRFYSPLTVPVYKVFAFIDPNAAWYNCKYFISDLNKKHPSIKFEFKYSQTTIEFLDVLVYKYHNNMLQTTVYRIQTDPLNYLNAQSEHPKLLIAYSTAKRY